VCFWPPTLGLKLSMPRCFEEGSTRRKQHAVACPHHRGMWQRLLHRPSRSRSHSRANTAAAQIIIRHNHLHCHGAMSVSCSWHAGAVSVLLMCRFDCLAGVVGAWLRRPERAGS
jgi:hypothetical protein